jgi:DNA-binding NarL/FixJ family response regulator
VRTVESHIYRAMQKLGASDRRELTRFTEPAP